MDDGFLERSDELSRNDGVDRQLEAGKEDGKPQAGFPNVFYMLISATTVTSETTTTCPVQKSEASFPQE